MSERIPPAAKGVCRCEARIAPAILEGYACGNPDCWRTEPVRASFAAFVETLVARRNSRKPAAEAETPHT